MTKAHPQWPHFLSHTDISAVRKHQTRCSNSSNFSSEEVHGNSLSGEFIYSCQLNMFNASKTTKFISRTQQTHARLISRNNSISMGYAFGDSVVSLKEVMSYQRKHLSLRICSIKFSFKNKTKWQILQFMSESRDPLHLLK